MGELHLEILVDRMKREFKVEANVGKPQVAYRETITQQGREGRATPTRSRRVAPASSPSVIITHRAARRRGATAATSSSTRSPVAASRASTSRRWTQGVQDAMEFGVLAGYPMVDVKVTLEDGAYHDVDSSEMAFKIAGSMAFKEAARRADPVLLEPMMAVEVTTPEDYMGDVIGDLNSRRGQIQAMDERWAAPRSSRRSCRCRRCSATSATCGRKTQGRASYSMQFDSYAEVPRERRRGDHPEGPRRVAADHAEQAQVHTARRNASRIRSKEESKWRRRSSSGRSRTSTSAPSVTSTTARPR